MNEILELAAKMPTGLIDPKSLEKAHHEMEEMRDALAGGDILGALMEAADVMYYAHKAYCNGLIAVDGRDGLIGDACREVGFDSHAVECALLAKYKLRAQPGNPKNDFAERAAVKSSLDPYVAVNIIERTHKQASIHA